MSISFFGNWEGKKNLIIVADNIRITNPAIETGMPFLFLAWLRRKPSIFCVWDLYPEVGIQMGIFRHPMVIRLIQMMEDFCLKRSTVVQSLADSFVSILENRVSSSNKINVIQPWIDTDSIRPISRHNSFSREFGLDDKFNVLYAGNLGVSQGLDLSGMVGGTTGLSGTSRSHYNPR